MRCIRLTTVPLSRFKKDWLHKPYDKMDHVKRCESNGSLPANEVKALLGVHKRHHKLADEPSALDIQLMKEVYGGGGKAGAVC